MTGAWWIDWCLVTGDWLTGDWWLNARCLVITEWPETGQPVTADWLTDAWLTGENCLVPGWLVDRLTSDCLTGDWWTYTLDAFSIRVEAHHAGSYPWQYRPVWWCYRQLNCHQTDLNWYPIFSSCSVSSLSSLIFLQPTFDVCLQVSRFLQTKYYM